MGIHIGVREWGIIRFGAQATVAGGVIMLTDQLSCRPAEFEKRRDERG